MLVAEAVDPRPADQRVDDLRDDRRLLRRRRAVARVLDGHEPQAGAAEPVAPTGSMRWRSRPALGVQPPVVRDLGDERAQTSGCIRWVVSRNRPSSLGHGGVVAEQVLERRHLGAFGMRCPSTAARAAADHRAARSIAPRALHATTSASDIWPASSTKSTSTESRIPGRAHSHGVPAIDVELVEPRLDVLRVVGRTRRCAVAAPLLVVRLLHRARSRRRLRRLIAQLVEQVADHRVRCGR